MGLGEDTFRILLAWMAERRRVDALVKRLIRMKNRAELIMFDNYVQFHSNIPLRGNIGWLMQVYPDHLKRRYPTVYKRYRRGEWLPY